MTVPLPQVCLDGPLLIYHPESDSVFWGDWSDVEGSADACLCHEIDPLNPPPGVVVPKRRFVPPPPVTVPPPPPTIQRGRLICESCNRGYHPTATVCPWCGCSSQMAHISHTSSRMDTECVGNYWLCMFDTGETFQLFDGHPLDIDGLRRALSLYTVITFNGVHYDMPMIALALAGCSNAQLKMANDMIIVQQQRHWDVLKQFGVAPLDWVDHIDLFDVAPGQGSLKAYGGKMHSRKLQDLPFDPNASFDWPERLSTREYCANDLRTTRDLFETFPAQIALREEMGAEYGVDLRSKSDAQIAEAAMKKTLPFKVDIPVIAAGVLFNYRAPAWLAFQTPALQRVLALTLALPFSVNDKGGVSPHYDNHLVDWGKDQVRLDHHGLYVSKPAGWTHETVRIGSTEYAMGTGGLHSMESRITWRADETYSLDSPDVASYYPSLIIQTGIYPQQIGSVFQDIYKGWYDSRLKSKRRAGELKKELKELKKMLRDLP